MQQPVGIARGLFQRMAEGMAQVQQRPLALFGLVARDDPGLHLDRPGHGMQPRRRVAGDQPGAVHLQPVEEAGIAEQAVFHHLAIARQQVAPGQRVQHADVGQHQPGLVKGADQVLALRGVDPGLAADRAVNLRQQRRRDLHEPHPAPQHGGGKAHQIAHHPAAKGHHDIAPLDLLLQAATRRSG